MKATNLEKALIFAYVAGYTDDLKEIYLLSRNEQNPETRDIKKLRTIVSRWKQRPDILKAFEFANKMMESRDQSNQDKGRQQAEEEQKQTETSPADSVRTETKRAGKVDYYDPQNQRRTINAIIDKAQDDPKTQLDAIKAIQQTQRDDRQAAKDNQIQRFYTPVSCRSCPFKAKAAKKG